MANRGGHPGRTLIIFGIIVAALYGLMAISNNWTPKLGLDLQGGTTITLTAQNTDGTGQIDPNSLQLARTIIQSRVDSLGVGETEVTTSGDRQIIVSVPNVQQDELVRLVGQTAVLRFRAVYAAEAVAPPPTASPGAVRVGFSRRHDGADDRALRRRAQRQSDRRPPTGPAAADRAPAADARPSPPRPGRARRRTRPSSGSRRRPTRRTSPRSPAIRQDAYPDVSDQPLVACNQEQTEKYLLGPTLIEGTQLTDGLGRRAAEPGPVGGEPRVQQRRRRDLRERHRHPGHPAAAGEPVRHRAGLRGHLARRR